MTERYIDIRGARQNNLKSVSLKIKHNCVTAITGVSGSGKSSLAFDTIFAEGQRRFVESQSTYARQFLERLDKPDVDHIEGLCPTIAVQSKNTYKSARSTVGTVTEVYDYLRLVFAKIGDLHCVECGSPVKPSTVDEMVAVVLAAADGEKAYVLTPLEISEMMTPALLKDMVRARGYSYIMAGSELIDLETAQDKKMESAVRQHGKGNGGVFDTGLFIVVDRLSLSSRKKSRIVDSFETAMKESGGIFKVRTVDGIEVVLTARAQCSACGLEVKRPAPQELSFNSPLGACPHCKGFGDVYEIDMDAIVPDRSKSLREGALTCWESSGIKKYTREMFKKPASKLGVRPDVPFSELTPVELERIMKGYEDLYGLEEFFERMKEKSYKISNRYFLSRYRSLNRCPNCNGTRLNPRALSTKLDGLSIAELGMLPVEEMNDFFESFDPGSSRAQMVKLPLSEIISRTRYLKEIGLGYISMWRMSRTLSGGEMQRIHLAGYLGSRLTGTLYVLDEPTVGLHPRDTDRLVQVLEDLRDLGNTIIIVEHDMQVVDRADRVVEMGPGPGDRGGEIVFEGLIKDFRKCKGSLTADYLTGRRSVADFKRKQMGTPSAFITVSGATHNNLKNIDASFPVNRFSCVTGVSGSGKSSLICDVLYPHAAMMLNGENISRGACLCLENIELFNFTEMMGQDPIGKNSRANPLTYVDLFSPIRQMFAATQEARRRGLAAGAFSFNTQDGRCPKCEGSGAIQIDMQFLADIYVKCDECEGSRYQPQVLEVLLRDKSIADIMNLTVHEALVFFNDSTPLVKKLSTLDEVGLGYIRIGQSLSTLSAGEGQRLKIAKELISASRGTGLFMFDEPTMGLHPNEVAAFLMCVDRLISEGHTVIVIEHNLDVIAQADFVMDLGPEGGDAGGQIVAQGTPSKIAATKKSITGKFLKEYLRKNK